MTRGIPTAVFCGNRPEHTERVLASLYRCQNLDRLSIHIFCDGPTEDDAALVEQTHNIVIECDLPILTCHFSKVKRGTTALVTESVTQLLEDDDRIIVIEDGMQLTPHCTTFLVQALERFAHTPELMQVSGWSYPIDPRTDCYTLRLAEPWVFGTWRRAWQHFDADAEQLLKRIEASDRLDAFNLEDAYKFSQILADQARGAIGSWSILCYASMFVNDGLCLFPGQTLATRSDPGDPFGSAPAFNPITVPDTLPGESFDARAAVADFYRGLRSGSVATKTREFIRRIRRH